MAFNRKLYSGVFFVCVIFGCAQSPIHEIFQKATYDWSIEDCRLILASATAHNIRSDSKILAMATPFTPLVVTALGRLQEKKNNLTEVQYQNYMDELMYSTLGMFVDWQGGQYVDKRGNYYKSNLEQLDSLMFLISLKNKTYPCVPPIFIGFVGSDQIHSQGVMGPLWQTTEQDWCYFPDISEIEKKIFLINERKDTLKPRFLWGRKGATLVDEETVFVMFPINSNGLHFLPKDKEFYLVIDGFDQTIRLKFDPPLLQ